MFKVFISDFSRVLLFPKDDNYVEGLNALHKKLSAGGDYDFWQYFRLNQELIDFYKTLGGKIDMYLLTSEHIQEHPALQPVIKDVFKSVLSGVRLGLKKNDTQTYKVIADKIGFKTEEILYIDDQQTNLDAAKATGMTVILYRSNKQAIQDISKALKYPA